ncbi:putative 5'-3' exoribonuclease [Rosa chinensis]|uniref:Putative 5'-3' exoribonuclease n=1 Tax=Rosa chinensis TaxID=74649 RepID=A0A2P6QED5_ROSCH|nr:putative 5'-3' exoribonuclease [Rosa chinensis]
MLSLATHEVHLSILRELDMQISDPPENFKFDLEGIIDDFIFICFFTGNDFLPHMPTLEIHEGAIDLLMTVYKKEFKNIGGYLIDMIQIYENVNSIRRLCYNNDWIEEDIDAGSSNFNFEAIEGSAVVSVDNVSSSKIVENTKEFKQKLKASIRRKSDLFRNGDFGTDKVRLGATGFKERYYKCKFSAESPGEIENKRKEVVKSYTEGLLWVLLYYFSGPPSWKWFYPFHYGPFASDMKGLAQVKPQFQKGSPFKPIDTLMAVLPPRSAHALPKDYRTLMMEECSTIIDFYPSDFEIDMDGKRFKWQGICKLPFIAESRLLHETRKLEKELMVSYSISYFSIILIEDVLS